jgi:hypothetical protein
MERRNEGIGISRSRDNSEVSVSHFHGWSVPCGALGRPHCLRRGYGSHYIPSSRDKWLGLIRKKISQSGNQLAKSGCPPLFARRGKIERQNEKLEYHVLMTDSEVFSYHVSKSGRSPLFARREERTRRNEGVGISRLGDSEVSLYHISITTKCLSISRQKATTPRCRCCHCCKLILLPSLYIFDSRYMGWA